MEGTWNQLSLQISMEIWEYLLDKGITMTRQYLPGAINKEADMHSWTIKDSSKWKLNPLVLQNLYKSWWTPDRPLHFQSFQSSSCLCLLETGSIEQRQGCFSNVLESHKMICFSPIFFNRQTCSQSFDRLRTVNFDNTSMVNPVLVPLVTKALNSKPFDFA